MYAPLIHKYHPSKSWKHRTPKKCFFNDLIMEEEVECTAYNEILDLVRKKSSPQFTVHNNSQSITCTTDHKNKMVSIIIQDPTGSKSFHAVF